LETWHQRGLLERFAGHLRLGAYGHFALLPGGLDLSELDTPRAAGLVPQATVEAVLADWAGGLGAGIRRGHRVIGLCQRPDGVTVDVAGPTGEYRLAAAYLVGCDGGRSSVRKLAGFEFTGTESTVDVLLADLAGVDAAAVDLPRRPFPFLRNEKGWVGLSSITAASVRIFACDFARPPVRDADPPSFADVRAAVAHIAGERVGDALAGGVPRWRSRFGNATRQATGYRIGRVLLAGDAAHVHPPFGGQGIGVGIQDAVNLGWKLAAEINGWAPPDLLDSYHAERHPAAGAILRLTQAQDALMQGGPWVASLRDFLTELAAVPAANRHLAAEVTGLNLRYPLDGEHGAELDSAVADLVGRRLPGAVEPLRAGRGALLLSADDTTAAEVAEPWRGRIDLVTDAAGEPRTAAALAEGTALLVRPDGHIAWAAGPTPIDHSGLEKALWRWFGAPPDRSARAEGSP
jgi:2-polyprenyl-6-methoxyphenol hydroxylase-like FAD-dependent oxidoreductase